MPFSACLYTWLKKIDNSYNLAEKDVTYITISRCFRHIRVILHTPQPPVGFHASSQDPLTLSASSNPELSLRKRRET